MSPVQAAPRTDPDAPCSLALPQQTLNELAENGLQLVRRVGGGASGEVWIAKNTKSGQYVATKLVRRNAAELGDCDRELAAVQRLRAHATDAEGLVDVGAPLELGDLFVYEMPLADDANGRFPTDRDASDQYEPLTLRWKLRHAGPLSVGECVEIGLCVLKGVEELHRKNLVHRDIKPENIVYIGGKAVLADVGLVATPDPALSQRGTPPYVPPEGCGKTRADIYAMGRLLYEMATGFPADGDIRPPGSLPAPLFVRLHHVYSIALDKEKRRYINTKALRVALENVTRSEPSLADARSTAEWIRIAAQTRKNCHLADPRLLGKYKKSIRKLIERAVEDARKELEVTTLGPDEFGEVTDEVIREFEKRLGFQPVRVLEVCNLAEQLVSMEGDPVTSRFLHLVMQGLGRRDWVLRRREKRAITCLIEGSEHAISELWEEHQMQFGDV